jgi:hypothetical protein
MIYEERTYELYPKTVAKYLELYEKHGMELHVRVLGKMIGFWTTDSGTLNSIVHLWAFEGFDERRRRRSALVAMPEWTKFTDMIIPLIIRQSNRFLIPTSFSPLK